MISNYQFLINRFYDSAQFQFKRGYPALVFFGEGPKFTYEKVYKNADKTIKSLKSFLKEQMGRSSKSKTQVSNSVNHAAHKFALCICTIKSIRIITMQLPFVSMNSI